MSGAAARPRRPLWSLLLALLGTLVCWWPLLGDGFYADDFVMLLRSARTTVAEVLQRDLLGGFLHDSSWPYWRPGWYLLFEIVYRCAGLVPWPYFAVALALHAAVVALVYAVLVRLSCRPWQAALGALLHATAADQLEAVAWPAAAFNVLPCAILVLASGVLLLRFARHGRARDYTLSLAACAASLLFKEAGYHLVLLALLGPLALRGRGGARFLARDAVLAVPFAALAVVHYLARNRVAAEGPGLALAAVTLRHAAAYLRDVLGVPIGDTALLVGVGVLGGALLAVARPVPRFLLLWSATALLPYAAMAHASRFAYFLHPPLALLAALLVRDLSERLPRVARASCWLGLAAVVVAGAVRVRSGLAEHRARGETCGSAIASLQALDLRPFSRLVVDVLPLELGEGLPEALELYCGGKWAVEPMHALRSPPFLIYWNPGFERYGDEVGYLRWDGATKRFALVQRAQLLDGAIAVPVVAVRYAARVLASPERLLEAIVRGGRDLEHTVFLGAEPGLVLGPPPERPAALLIRGVGALSYRIDVQVGSNALLVVSLPIDLSAAGAMATLDGEPVPLLPANGRFNAVAVPAGSHVVRIATR